jgi:hypothetical protein
MSEHDTSEPQRCHCGRGFFNPDIYDECARCRRAFVDAINAARRVLGARIIGTPSFPHPLFSRGA